MALNNYRGNVLFSNPVTKVPQWFPKKRVFLRMGHQSPTMVTEETSFPPNGSSKSYNGYRRKGFLSKRVTNRPQWLPRKGVFRPKGHQSPSIVPAKGSLKAFNGYRSKEFSAKRVTKGPNGYQGKEFSTKWVTNRPQWLPRKGVFH